MLTVAYEWSNSYSLHHIGGPNARLAREKAVILLLLRDRRYFPSINVIPISNTKKFYGDLVESGRSIVMIPFRVIHGREFLRVLLSSSSSDLFYNKTATQGKKIEAGLYVLSKQS